MEEIKRIKLLTAVVAVVFFCAIVTDILFSIKDEKILKMQLDAVENYNLRKDRYLNLNNAYREIFINYDKLEESSLALTNNVKKLQSKYSHIDGIKDVMSIIEKQNAYLDYIKLHNTKIFKALDKTHKSSLQLFKYLDISDVNAMELLFLSRKINDAFLNIRSNRKSTFKKVRKNIQLISKIRIHDPKLDNIRNNTIQNALSVLSNAIELRNYLKEFNALESKLDEKYMIIKSNFKMKHKEFDEYGKINTAIVLVLLIVFLYLINKLIIAERKRKKEINELIKTQDQKIKDAVKDIEVQKEKALEAAKSKSEFLANMSHEIRTPLNGILGFVDILKDTIKDKESLGHLNIIDSSSQHLLGIINDILDYSKIENGKLDIEKIDFDIKKELDFTIDLFKAKASEKHIFLNVIYDKGLPKVLNGDPLRIKQVISNFLSNAIKFTKNDHDIDTTISYKNGILKVSVKDQGIGIAKEKLNLIFEAFSQEDSTTTRRFGGTGLGLSISKELVHLMGGDIDVKSEIKKGSTFSFSVPVTIGGDIKEIKTSIQKFSFKGKKLLLVEDNESNIMFMKVILKKLEFDFDIAYDGIEAIESFKKSKYDFILMDENMPNMGGIEAMQNIRALEKEQNLESTIIIALTANALKGDRERFMDAGMDEYLTKPLKRKKLEEVLSLFS